MDSDKLKEWRSSLEAEVEGLKNQIHSLSSEVQRKTQQIELITKLIESAEGNRSEAHETVPDPARLSPISQLATPSQVKDNVYAILRAAKRPMNINEIHAEFLQRAYPIPGKGTAFNILVHIGRELKLGKRARFYRAGRGTYALRGTTLNENS